MKIKLKNRSCPNCNFDKFKIILTTRDYRFDSKDTNYNIVKCQKCGLCYLNPIFPENILKFFYKEGFYFKYKNILLNKITYFVSHFIIKNTINSLKKYKINGTVIDVGCGNGVLVSELLNHGYDAYGVDINSDAGKIMDGKLNDRIKFLELNDSGFVENSIDIITTNHVLEHVYNLKPFLLDIKKYLKPNGLFYIKVPNNSFFEYKLFNQYAYNLEVPRHLSFFTKKTLKKVLENSGFYNIKFIKQSVFSILSTPASFYYSIKYYLSDRKIVLPYLIDRLLFYIMIFVRFIIRILFLYQDQDLQVIASKK